LARRTATIKIAGPLSSSVWLILAFKVPIVVLVGLLAWWASRSEPGGADEAGSDDDGGIRRHHRPHPRRPFPRPPRRGPHGDPAPAPPSRVRTVRARARSLEH
jgi:hypothetical protein